MESKPKRLGHRLLSGWWEHFPCVSITLLSAIMHQSKLVELNAL